MQLTIIGFSEGKRCEYCEKDTDTFRVRCEAGTLDAELCARCLARQCRMRAKAKELANGSSLPARAQGGAA